MANFTIIGHRGACAHEPENTLRSVLRGIEDGADMIEVDVRLADGQIIVIHDDTLNRTTDGGGSVYEKGFADLRKADAGAGEQIPTLEEVLELTAEKLPLNIEIKDTDVTGAVCELVRRFPKLDLERVLISSFHTEAVRQAREELPNVPIGILAHDEDGVIDAMFQLADELGAVSVNPHVSSVTPDVVQQAHATGFRVLSYTARTTEQVDHLLACNADGCFADDPAWVRRYAKSKT